MQHEEPLTQPPLRGILDPNFGPHLSFDVLAQLKATAATAYETPHNLNHQHESCGTTPAATYKKRTPDFWFEKYSSAMTKLQSHPIAELALDELHAVLRAFQCKITDVRKHEAREQVAAIVQQHPTGLPMLAVTDFAPPRSAAVFTPTATASLSTSSTITSIASTLAPTAALSSFDKMISQQSLLVALPRSQAQQNMTARHQCIESFGRLTWLLTMGLRSGALPSSVQIDLPLKYAGHCNVLSMVRGLLRIADDARLLVPDRMEQADATSLRDYLKALHSCQAASSAALPLHERCFSDSVFLLALANLHQDYLQQPLLALDILRTLAPSVQLLDAMTSTAMAAPHDSFLLAFFVKIKARLGNAYRFVRDQQDAAVRELHEAWTRLLVFGGRKQYRGLRASTSVLLGKACLSTRQLDSAKLALTNAVALYQDIQDNNPANLVWATHNLARVHMELGEFVQATALCETLKLLAAGNACRFAQQQSLHADVLREQFYRQMDSLTSAPRPPSSLLHDALSRVKTAQVHWQARSTSACSCPAWFIKHNHRCRELLLQATGDQPTTSAPALV